LKYAVNVKLICAFVTFSTISAKNKIQDLYSTSSFQRFASKFINCCKRRNTGGFEENKLYSIIAEDPGSILWQNLGEPASSIFFRRALSAGLTLAFWIFTAAILIVATYYQNVFSSSFPSVDCSDKNPTRAQAAADYSLGQYQAGLLECYCSDNLTSKLNEIFTEADNQKLCRTWFTKKVLAEGMTILIVIIVEIVNFCVEFIFEVLAKFEKHSTVNTEDSQKVLKTFIGQFLNTGLIILFVNVKIDSISFWQGSYSDTIPLWFANVGSTILSTMFINMLTVPSAVFSSMILKKISQWYDRKFSSNMRITRKKTQEAYEKVYTSAEFVIDSRYSQILTLIYVCFLYSSGMPFLYITTGIQLILTYFFDKIVLLKYSKLPKNYDGKLEAAVRITLYIIVILHPCLGIFMYGMPEYFTNDISYINPSDTTIGKIGERIAKNQENPIRKFFRRITMPWNYVLISVVAFCAITFLLKGVLYNFYKTKILAAFRKDQGISSQIFCITF